MWICQIQVILFMRQILVGAVITSIPKMERLKGTTLPNDSFEKAGNLVEGAQVYFERLA